MVHQIGSDQEFDKFVASNLPSVIDFFATWCGPCKAIAPAFEQLAGKYAKQAQFGKVDVDQLSNVASMCEIRAMPTFQIWKKGKCLFRIQGGDLGAVERELQKHLEPVFEAFVGGGKTLGGSSAAAAGGTAASAAPNRWAEERAKHVAALQERMKAQAAAAAAPAPAAPAAAVSDPMVDDEEEELKRAIELSKQQAEQPSAAAAAEGGEASGAAAAPAAAAAGGGLSPEEVMAAVEKTVNESFLQELLSMEFPKIRALKALVNTGNASVDAAVDWIFQHQDDKDIDAPFEYSTETEEQKQQRLAQAKEKAKEMQAALRAKQAEEAKQKELEREKIRRNMGKQINEAQAQYKEAQRQREIDEAKRQKQKELEEKKRMKQLLAEDKARRQAERMATEKDIAGLKTLAQEFPDIANKYLLELGVQAGSAASAPAPAPVAAPAAPAASAAAAPAASAAAAATQVDIQLRLLDGSTQRATFKPQDTLQTVYDQAKQLMGGKTAAFNLMSPFPRKTFAAPELKMTLEALKLVPRAQLICAPK